MAKVHRNLNIFCFFFSFVIADLLITTLCQECETFLMNLLKKNGKIDNKILKLKIEEKSIFKLL